MGAFVRVADHGGAIKKGLHGLRKEGSRMTTSTEAEPKGHPYRVFQTKANPEFVTIGPVTHILFRGDEAVGEVCGHEVGLRLFLNEGVVLKHDDDDLELVPIEACSEKDMANAS